MSITFGSDPVRDAVRDALERLARGEVVDASAERVNLDLKEEAGRRDRAGRVGPGGARNERAAQQLAAEASCMANTPGGGALVVGVADDGGLPGAELDGEWLRHRIYELTERSLTVDVSVAMVCDTRLLVLLCPQAVQPIRFNGRVTWRVDDHCVEIDPATWHGRRLATLGHDWSSEASTLDVDNVRAQALEVARDYLNESADPSAAELAAADDLQLLRRLSAVTSDGFLTNAGVLAFVGRGSAALDYLHREVAGGDSTQRVRRAGRSLLEELVEVFGAIDAHNATHHLHSGLASGQVQDVPRLAAREAVVNGVAHRDWHVAGPTVVEHIGRSLRVTSPGGFFGGVNETNILTHPPTSRNRALAQLLADVKVAEREGIGVDRMVREMVRAGHQPPEIREISGPHVRASLVGDAVDEPWVAWLALLRPRSDSHDVNSLLLLRQLIEVGWVDAPTAARLVQLTAHEAGGAIEKLARATIDDKPLVHLVDGVPGGTEPVWSMAGAAFDALAYLDGRAGQIRARPDRPEVARSYAAARGRISTTELGSLVGAHSTNVGGVLKGLEEDGLLAPSSPERRGRGFFYRWIGDAGAR